MRVLMIQNSVLETVDKNLKHIKKIVNKVPSKDIDFIVFPEMFTTPYEMKYFKKNKQNKNGEVIHFLKQTAIKFNSYIIGGSIPESFDKKLFNTTYIINRQGEIIQKYRKIHLFSITYPNGQTFNESDTLSKGEEIVTFDTDLGRMGVMICFDIRFPMQARSLRQKGAKVIFIPAAFNTFTGPMHWHTTFKARAIDNQLFVIGVSPARDSFGQYEPYGHSLAINPLGNIIKELDETEGWGIVDIDLSEVQTIRERIPIVKNDV